MEEGYTEPWDLADQLGVSEKFVRDMLVYYTQARGVDFATELEQRHEESH